MFKKIRLKSTYNILPDMFILVGDNYYPILSVSNHGGTAVVKAQDLEVTIDDDNFNDFEFASVVDTKEIKTNVVYSCNHCNQDIAFETFESAVQHTKQCLFNEDNKKCVMCKHLKIIMNPPYPRFAHMYLTEDMYHAFQSYNQPYCMFKEKNIDELEAFAIHEDCFEVDTDTPVIERSEEYEKWVELSLQVDDLQAQEEEEFKKE